MGFQPKDGSDPLDWKMILGKAVEIVDGYDTGVTLRQLFYRLVSAQLIPNKQWAYKQLSSKSAKARREESFPDLIDNTRFIRRAQNYESPQEAVEELIGTYRRERTDGQEYSLYVGVEKNALAGQLFHWFGERGIPVIALGGYPSQTFVDEIIWDIQSQGRPAILIYGGDFDPTGVDILRSFTKLTQGHWDDIHRVALNPDQVTKYKLPVLEGKSWDARAKGFVETFGKLMQVELDALPPDVLKKLYTDKVDEYWDEDAYQEVLEEESEERKKIILPTEVKKFHDELKFISDINHPEDITTSAMLKELLKKYKEVFND